MSTTTGRICRHWQISAILLLQADIKSLVKIPDLSRNNSYLGTHYWD